MTDISHIAVQTDHVHNAPVHIESATLGQPQVVRTVRHEAEDSLLLMPTAVMHSETDSSADETSPKTFIDADETFPKTLIDFSMEQTACKTRDVSAQNQSRSLTATTNTRIHQDATRRRTSRSAAHLDRDITQLPYCDTKTISQERKIQQTPLHQSPPRSTGSQLKSIGKGNKGCYSNRDSGVQSGSIQTQTVALSAEVCRETCEQLSSSCSKRDIRLLFIVLNKKNHIQTPAADDTDVMLDIEYLLRKYKQSSDWDDALQRLQGHGLDNAHRILSSSIESPFSCCMI